MAVRREKRPVYRVVDGVPTPIPVMLDSLPEDGCHFLEMEDAWSWLENEADAAISLAQSSLRQANHRRDMALAECAAAVELRDAVTKARRKAQDG